MTYRYLFKDPIRIKIRPSHKQSIDDLIDSWDFKTQENVSGLLEKYFERHGFIQEAMDVGKWVGKGAKWLMGEDEEHSIKELSDPTILKDWKKRFEATDEIDRNKAFDKLFEDELGKTGIYYTIKRLREETKNTYVPEKFGDLLLRTYQKHLQQKVEADDLALSSLPRAPLIMVVGGTGAGKSATVVQAIDEYLRMGSIAVEEDYTEKIEQLQREKPITWELHNRKVVEEIESQKWRDKFFKVRKNKKALKELYKERPELFERFEEMEQSDLGLVTIEPSDVQTAWAGETGNYLKKAIGNMDDTKVVHFEEFQNTAGKVGEHEVSQSQQGTLVTTLNSYLDGVIRGTINHMVIATTNNPKMIAEDVFRRFDEAGIVVDISKVWRDKKNLEPLVRMEAHQHNLKDITDEEFAKVTDKVYDVFDERTLQLSPAYARKLLSSIIDEKDILNVDIFDDKFALRKAFETVALNLHHDLYKRTVKPSPRNLEWEDYKGRIKDDFSAHANSCLRFANEKKKGSVLVGPPGGGKTFLTMVYAAVNPDITYMSVGQQDLQDAQRPIDGMVENVDNVYNIAKMLAPTILNIQEGDAVVQARSSDGRNPYDRVTNQFLDILCGEKPLRGVYTTITSNLPDKIDGALIRSGRLDLKEVTGRLSERNKKKLIAAHLDGLVLGEGVNVESIYKKTEGVCYVPADYAKFVGDIQGLQDDQFKVITRLKKHLDGDKKELRAYLEQNTKAVVGVLKYFEYAPRVVQEARINPRALLDKKDLLQELTGRVNTIQDYPIKRTHLDQALDDFVDDPMRSGLEKKKAFMSYEKSGEPQPGFVIGVGANQMFGVLTPIKTSLPDRKTEKVDVTGAVKSESLMDNMDKFVEMMTHSAWEAKTLVENYLSQLFLEQDELKDCNPQWAVNELLKNRTIHHQFLTADYGGGGPSAGFALSVNTLSVLLNLDVMNDFGITGAPWTGGKMKKDVGSSVIIGSAPQKSDAVLNEDGLRRMFLPHKNYSDLPLDQHESYWPLGKLVRPVYNFRQLVPEVYAFDTEYKGRIDTLLESQIAHLKEEAHQTEHSGKFKKETDALLCDMSAYAETEVLRRAKCLYNFALEKNRSKHSLSLQAIYEKGGFFDNAPERMFEKSR